MKGTRADRLTSMPVGEVHLSSDRATLYAEASNMLRSCDSLSYNLLQYYAALFAAALAFGPSSDLSVDQVGWLLLGVSVVGLLLTARLRRNYSYFQLVCQRLEESMTSIEGERPQSFADLRLKRFDIHHFIALVPAKWLYYFFYAAGGTWSLWLTGVVPPIELK